MSAVGEFHTVVREAAEKVRDDAGTFVSIVSVGWKDGKIADITTQMGTTSKYDGETGYAKKEEET